MLKENGEWSFTRWLVLVGYSSFLIGSAYLLIRNINWVGYPTFATFTGGLSGCVQVGNKFVNGKYNTPLGQSGKPERPSGDCLEVNRDR